MRVKLFAAVLFVFFSSSAFAGHQRTYRGWGSDSEIDVQVLGTEVRTKEKLLFLDLKDHYYAVVELSQCSPKVKVNSKIKGTWLKGRMRFEHPGTINGGPFYLADKTFCEVQIVVSTLKQKQQWELIFNPRIPNL